MRKEKKADEDAVRVLVVEDHQPTRQELVGLIGQQKGTSVLADVGTGEEAVEAARRLRPTVVVMDMQLPGMNGIEATRIVMSELPETRIIAVSNHLDAGLISAFIDAGGMGYICKGRAFEELGPAIRAAKDNYRYFGMGVTPPG